MTEFTSLESFALHLGAMIEAEHKVAEKLLDHGAAVIEKAAKDKIGEYQGQAGPFVAWAELADSTKEDRSRQGYTENDPGLRSGEMRDSIGRRVGPAEAQIGSDDDHMVYFELGTDKQPPRSALGAAAIETGEKVANLVGKGFAAALVGEGVVGGRLAIEQD